MYRFFLRAWDVCRLGRFCLCLITLIWGASGIELESGVSCHSCFRDDLSGHLWEGSVPRPSSCAATSQSCSGRHWSHLINTGGREHCAGRLIEPMGHSLTVRAESISQNVHSAMWKRSEEKEVVMVEMLGLNLETNSTIFGLHRCFSPLYNLVITVPLCHQCV